jgi:NAD(P)-dependent dehydrogenase (short-subunit alcohol dehydrogenase family)
MRLQGRKAIITGGAGGIGRVITKLFVENGATVLVADLLDEDGKALEQQLNGKGTKVRYRHTDVTQSGDVIAAVDQAAREFGPPDILVNCAGWLRVTMATEADEKDFDLTLASHVKGTWLFAKHAIPHMMKAGRGAIVNISSMQALQAIPGRVAYEAAKGGISAMTRAMAVEYGPAGIRVNAVCPGMIVTDRNRANVNAQFSEADMQKRLECYPLRRLGAPEDVANAILFLASDEASWISGVDLLVDGGISIQLTEAVHFPPFRELWRATVPQA